MSRSLIILQFQEFYYEILKCKDEALRVVDITIEFNEEDQRIHAKSLETFEYIQKTLKTFLEGKKIIKEVKYSMVALADEIFLTLPWTGAYLWEHALLEVHFFHSQTAGEFLYHEIDHLIKNYDASRSDLALIYFWTLSLGFQGQYQDYPEKIQTYIEGLYILIQKDNPKLRTPSMPYLMPPCYDNVLDGPPHRGLPDMQMWITSIASIVLFYIFSTYILWYDFVSGLYKALQTLKGA